MGPIEGPKFKCIEGYCESCVEVKKDLNVKCKC